MFPETGLREKGGFRAKKAQSFPYEAISLHLGGVEGQKRSFSEKVRPIEKMGAVMGQNGGSGLPSHSCKKGLKQAFWEGNPILLVFKQKPIKSG